MGLTSTLSFQAIVIWSSTSLTVFDRIKQCRRITTTRYDKLAANYLAFVQRASIPLSAAR
jgi:transposase